MSNKAIPLPVVLEQARAKIISHTNEVIKESKLPAFMMESIFLEILADLRESKVRELSTELIRVISEDAAEEK